MYQLGLSRKHLLLALFASITIAAGSGGNIGPLNVCGPDTSDETFSSLVFVSTLDGNLHALDLNNNGEEKWSVDFDYKPLLSSSIHTRELNNDGRWVRLIPSLSGGLYKFDGENLEALPVTPQQLLRSSFRYSDDLVLSGSGETHTYGVSSSTGKILYHCHEGSCTNMTESKSSLGQDVLVVRRFQDTIRAAEPRTGQERWNYSVGQHELELIPYQNHKCNTKLLQKMQEIDLRVNVPDGLIWAIDKSKPEMKLWQYKLDSPIVSVWREHGSQVESESLPENPTRLVALNLFESTEWNWSSLFTVSPSIYVGMHKRQLYIQENVNYVKMIETSNSIEKTPKIFPWRPYPASDTAVAIREENASLSTSLSVLYNSELINGNGFFLHSKDQEESNQCNNRSHRIPDIPFLERNDDEETPVQVIIVSLWHWWKEVFVLVISGAILLNYLAPQRVLNAIIGAKQGSVPPLIVERHIITKEEPKPLSAVQYEFVSRYLTDFDPVDCLGKGGYGVVFEARKKIDHVNYAVKRITLPNREDARERVMREVRALANLDHQNIVRYFHAWLECPPAGWKEQHDSLYVNGKFSSSEFPSEVSMTPSKPNGGAVCIDLPGSSKSSVDSAFEAVKLNNHTDDSSFIVFEDEKSEDSVVTQETCEQSDCESSQSGTDPMTEDDDSVVFRNSDKTTDDHSESIVFEATDSRQDSESVVFKNTTSGSEVKSERSDVEMRKRSLSLNLKDKAAPKKVPRMFLYIQMQLCHKESLREWLKRQTSQTNTDNIESIFQQIVDGVEYVHLHGLIHRDLKPSNIFFSYDKKVKIGDFGLATAMIEGLDEPRTPSDANQVIQDGLHTAQVGTHLYMAPEQMNGQIYNYKVDIYSLGIILFELLFPFTTDMERVTALMNLRKSIFPAGFEERHPRAFELLKMMLDENPAKRPTTLGIKARPPLAKTEWIINEGEDDTKWHFELPQLNRHFSVNNSSSDGSWDISTSQSHE